MRKPSKKVVETVVGSGEHIYAYCNVKTNQVLYSLTSRLQDVSLDQLPDIGANYKPPTIRPDLWKPLFSVTLPSPEQGRGLFGKLKEWRKLHELYWEPPSYLSNPYTEKQIAEMKEKLENRGGSKKETVFDVIKRQKKKMKQKIVMNQKANSIADLAAVLIEQEDQGTVMAEERRQNLKRKVKAEINHIFKLAKEYEEGGLKKLDDESDMIRAMLAEGVDGLNSNLLEEQKVAELKLKQMVYAHAVVREAKAFAELSQAERQQEAGHWRALVEVEDSSKPEEQDELTERKLSPAAAFAATMRREYDQTWEQIAVASRAEGYEAPKPESKTVAEDAQAAEAVQAGQKEPQWESEPEPKLESKAVGEETSAAEAVQPGQREPKQEKIDYKTIIPRFPPSLDPKGLLPQRLPKWATAKYAAMRTDQPIFTTKGVKVEWANFLDAEFAKAWPEAVEHQPMGGNREKYETVRAEKQERRSKYQLELAEMVELKRREMGLSQNESEEEDDMMEEVDEEAPREKTLEESAAEIVAAEELEAKEAAARQSAIQTLKAIRRKQRLPPQLEGIQSEILAREQAASTPRRQVLSKPTEHRPEATPAQ